MLDQPAYTGPAPRFPVGATVYYQGQPYTVSAVVGRAPTVGWVYELDGPAELLQVGEREISGGPQTGHSGQLAALRPIYGLWLDPRMAAAAQQAADAERMLLNICVLAGQPPGVVRAALATWVHGLDALLDALKAGTVIITVDGDVVSRPPGLTRDWGAGMATRASAFTKIILP